MSIRGGEKVSISKFEYSQKVGNCGERLIQAANDYADHSNTANFKTKEDLYDFKKVWLSIVDEFRIIQSDLNALEIPKGHEKKGEELRKAYQKYVDYVEEKTIKFGDVEFKEIEIIQKLEIEQSEIIKNITNEITTDLFFT